MQHTYVRPSWINASLLYDQMFTYICIFEQSVVVIIADPSSLPPLSLPLPSLPSDNEKFVGGPGGEIRELLRAAAGKYEAALTHDVQYSEQHQIPHRCLRVGCKSCDHHVMLFRALRVHVCRSLFVC